MAKKKQAPSNEPPAASQTTSASAEGQAPMSLSQEEVDGLVSGTIDSASLDRRDNTDVVTGAVAVEGGVADPGSKGGPSEDPPG